MTDTVDSQRSSAAKRSGMAAADSGLTVRRRVDLHSLGRRRAHADLRCRPILPFEPSGGPALVSVTTPADFRFGNDPVHARRFIVLPEAVEVSSLMAA